MDFYNTNYYDKASYEYSNKRYSVVSKSYIQFFFKRRLDIILRYIEKDYLKNINISEDKKLRILEDGCADGVVIESILKNFPNIFSECIGIDISPEMIKTARIKNKLNNVSYYMKGTEVSSLFDIILAVGFVSPSLFEEEFAYIRKHLNKNGIIIISLASKKSLYTILKLKDKEYVKDYWTHGDYKSLLEKEFKVIDSIPCGFFIPKLWSLPTLARIIQPIVENIMRHIAPDLFHEKLYILKNKF
jgi:2-polyprenyl-3-methyl-5-hydroxy-6-metoxy-1,4-benzoquinol methylase